MILIQGLCLMASAQDDRVDADLARAEAAFDSGQLAFDEGNYEAAILAFRDSLALSGKSELHFNLAYCFELLGRLEEAYDELERYRKVAPESQQASLERRLQAIRDRIDAARVPPPVPVAAPFALVEPEPVRLHATDWVFVGSGAAVGAFSLVGVGLTWSSAARHLDQNDRPAYRVDRALNVTSWLGSTIGASLILTGIVRASATTVSFDGETVTLQGRFGRSAP